MATLKCSQMVLGLFLASQAFSLAQYKHVIVMYVVLFSIVVKEMEVKGQEKVRVTILPRFIVVLLMLVVLLVLARPERKTSAGYFPLHWSGETYTR